MKNQILLFKIKERFILYCSIASGYRETLLNITQLKEFLSIHILDLGISFPLSPCLTLFCLQLLYVSFLPSHFILLAEAVMCTSHLHNRHPIILFLLASSLNNGHYSWLFYVSFLCISPLPRLFFQMKCCIISFFVWKKIDDYYLKCQWILFGLTRDFKDQFCSTQ